jgi:DNA-binding transcriptional LysR family regulator
MSCKIFLLISANKGKTFTHAEKSLEVIAMSRLQSLSVFFSVAQVGSFSAAAKMLSITQPTVSFHIDNLEKDFGCPLFTRTAKGVALTIYGQKVYDNTHKINSLLTHTHNEIKAMLLGSSGRIIIGASTIPAEYILPSIISDFLRQHPGVKISLKTGNSSAILAAFRNGEVPIALIGIKPDDDLTQFPLWQDELVLVAHPETANDLGPAPELTQIARCPVILREAASGTGTAVSKALSVQNVSMDQLNVVLQVGGNESLKAAVINKAGIGFISRWAVQQELSDGRLCIINLPGTKILRRFYAVCNLPLIPKCQELFWNFLLSAQPPHNQSPL